MHRHTRGRWSGGRGMDMNQGPGSNSRGLAFIDQTHSPAMAGPSVIEDLQLHELDKELALLKLRRELIEQQHNKLMNDQSFGPSNQYSYGKPFGQSEFIEPWSGAVRNVGSFYGEHATAASPAPLVNTARFGRKRPAQQWPTAAPKRFNAPGGRNRQRGPRTPSVPQPGTSSFRPAQPDVAPPQSTQRPPQSNRPLASENRNFKNGKIKKTFKNPSAPNNLQNYPVNERKNLVNQALNSDEYILRQDQPPSTKLTGRLEQALGFYLKQLRLQHESGPFAVVFTSPFKLRLLKKSIRERIRSAMLDKEAGQINEIMATVRDSYPVSSDVDILQTVLDTMPATQHAITPVDAVDPETYIRNNFNLLLGRKLNEMFGKLKQMYKNDDESTGKMMDNMLVELAANNIKDNVPPNHIESTGATDDKPSTEVNVSIECSVKCEENEIVVEVPPVEAIEDPQRYSVAVQKAENVNDKNTNDASVNSATKLDNVVAPAMKFQQDIKVFDKKYPQGGVIDKPAIFYNQLVDRLIKHRLPHVLPHYKEQLIEILRSDSGYTETKAYLLRQANKKAEQQHRESQPASDEHLAINLTTQDKLQNKNTNYRKQHKFSPYLVKILGRPSLPKRNKMKVFLDQFNPASIKKHRGIHNLLFVGIDTIEDYEKLLGADGTVVGNAKLEIKSSGKVGRGNDNAASINVNPETDDQSDSPNTVVIIDDATDEPLEVAQEKADFESDNFVNDGSLNDQITNLFTSIQNEEEINGKGETIIADPDTVLTQNGNVTDASDRSEPRSDYSDDVQFIECPGPDIIEIDDSHGEMSGPQIE